MCYLKYLELFVFWIFTFILYRWLNIKILFPFAQIRVRLLPVGVTFWLSTIKLGSVPWETVVDSDFRTDQGHVRNTLELRQAVHPSRERKKSFHHDHGYIITTYCMYLLLETIMLAFSHYKVTKYCRFVMSENSASDTCHHIQPFAAGSETRLK